MKSAFIQKSAENLKAAHICFDNSLYNACANRLYYSAFQAAIAALDQNGIHKEKINHRWVQADFSGELIKRQKIFPAKMKSYLSDMQYIRDKADYTTENVSRKILGRWLPRIREFIELVQKEINP